MPYQPRKSPARKRSPLKILAIGSLAGFGIAVVAHLIDRRLEVLSARNQPAPVVEIHRAADPRDTFARLMFKTETEVVALAGSPDARYVSGENISLYYSSGHEVAFIDDEVLDVSLKTPEEIADKIATAKLHGGVAPPTVFIKRRELYTPFRANLRARERTMDEIRSEFGEPSMREIISGREVWTYLDLVEENGEFIPLTIRFHGDIVAITKIGNEQ